MLTYDDENTYWIAGKDACAPGGGIFRASTNVAACLNPPERFFPSDPVRKGIAKRQIKRRHREGRQTIEK
jgi:hypothetical protein